MGYRSLPKAYWRGFSLIVNVEKIDFCVLIINLVEKVVFIIKNLKKFKWVNIGNKPQLCFLRFLKNQKWLLNYCKNPPSNIYSI